MSNLSTFSQNRTAANMLGNSFVKKMRVKFAEERGIPLYAAHKTFVDRVGSSANFEKLTLENENLIHDTIVGNMDDGKTYLYYGLQDEEVAHFESTGCLETEEIDGKLIVKKFCTHPQTLALAKYRMANNIVDLINDGYDSYLSVAMTRIKGEPRLEKNMAWLNPQSQDVSEGLRNLNISQSVYIAAIGQNDGLTYEQKMELCFKLMNARLIYNNTMIAANKVAASIVATRKQAQKDALALATQKKREAQAAIDNAETEAFLDNNPDILFAYAQDGSRWTYTVKGIKSAYKAWNAKRKQHEERQKRLDAVQAAQEAARQAFQAKVSNGKAQAKQALMDAWLALELTKKQAKLYGGVPNNEGIAYAIHMKKLAARLPVRSTEDYLDR